MKEIDNSENIILGSGDLYIVEFNDAVPEDATIEIDDNRAGNIKGGATLEYTATRHQGTGCCSDQPDREGRQGPRF